MRFVENHDNERVMALAANLEQGLAWTAFQAFNKGAWLIYAGQESAAGHLPSLFEKEPVQWDDYALADFHRRLASLKKDPAVTQGELIWSQKDPVAWQAFLTLMVIPAK
jgi:hypothetical protein